VRTKIQMSTILDQILTTKRTEVAAAQLIRSLDVVKADAIAANIANPPRDFAGALIKTVAAKKLAVIAEFKRASPSAGTIRSDLNPADVAKSYEALGAVCMSVLTDKDYFGGSTQDLIDARAACKLPIIRKDFIVSEYQLYESRSMGADAVLFIIGAMPISEFLRLETIAIELGLSVLAEVHDAPQLDDALKLKTPLMGINNRDLKRFSVDLQNTIDLAPKIPTNRLVISESGIESASDISHLLDSNVSAYLVGTSLMKSDNSEWLKILLNQ
jgi:indole-3-glycerol phosphate synthase